MPKIIKRLPDTKFRTAPIKEKDYALRDSEKGTMGLACSTNNASWIADDVPINLNLFSIVTRQIILKWLATVDAERKAAQP